MEEIDRGTDGRSVDETFPDKLRAEDARVLPARVSRKPIRHLFVCLKDEIRADPLSLIWRIERLLPTRHGTTIAAPRVGRLRVEKFDALVPPGSAFPNVRIVPEEVTEFQHYPTRCWYIKRNFCKDEAGNHYRGFFKLLWYAHNWCAVRSKGPLARTR